MILFKPIVQIRAGAMQNIFDKFALDSCWVAILAVGGDAIRDHSGHRSRRTEERFGGREVPMLAQQYVDQHTISINSPIQVAAWALDFDAGFIDIAARSYAMAPTSAKLFS
jgi:hypothetical protein